MPRKVTKKPQLPEYPKVCEQFGEPYIGTGHWAHQEPSVFNSNVRVERYRITVEKIEEPVEVVRERITKLWRESDNGHDTWPLRQAAEAHGLVLAAEERGRDVRQTKERNRNRHLIIRPYSSVDDAEPSLVPTWHDPDVVAYGRKLGPLDVIQRGDLAMHGGPPRESMEWGYIVGFEASRIYVRPVEVGGVVVAGTIQRDRLGVLITSGVAEKAYLLSADRTRYVRLMWCSVADVSLPGAIILSPVGSSLP